MHRVTFYPVANGDTSQIILEDGRRLLFDYRHMKKSESSDRPEINLKEQLRKELKDAGRDSFDVVAFTHGDKDHIENSTEFFELQHAEKYQGSGRIKIDVLWVPAAMILDTAASDHQSDEFVIWRQEARYRLKKGKGVRVFSKPKKLKAWLNENGLTVESRKHLITDAGQLVPEFTLEDDKVEFFCHSPFVKHTDEGDDMRNQAALIFNVRLRQGQNDFDFLAVGDSKWEVLEDIVQITKDHDNMDRLSWDLYNLPHHCSYLSLSDEKGATETTPKPLVKELLQQGKAGAYVVSSSEPIASDQAAYEQVQPPHVQAKRTYERYLRECDGAKFIVTMEEPNSSKPKPIEFKVDSDGISRADKSASAAAILTAEPARRAGSSG